MRIQLIGISREFISARGRTFASKEIDLEILDREFFVLLGPSGCGKSTVLNLIAGLEKPTGGEIWFDDKLVVSAERRIFRSPRERNIAMVFQSYALYPHLSVFDNIAFPLEIAKEQKSAIRESVERVAATLGIEGLLASRPGELSGGQRQRVAIARALVRRPSVFLMDEPLSNLDAQLRTSTRTELKALQRRLGITTIYVTHDQVEAMSLGDRVAVLRQGRLEQVGLPQDLYEEPANTFVARFIASPPMNLLNISLESLNGSHLILLAGMELPINVGDLSPFVNLDSGEWILGIRPEDVRIVSDRGGERIQGTVQVIEPLGREILLHLAIGNQELAVLTDNTRYAETRVGELVSVEPDLHKAHLFSTDGNRVH